MSRAADRVLEALQHLADHIELGVVELGLLMKIDKSSAHRILAALTEKGFAVRIAESRRYRLGAEAARVGYAYVKSHDLPREVLPSLQRLADQTGETVTLAIYDRGSAMVLERVEGVDRVRTVSEVGLRAPIHAGASCKVLLAYQPHTELERVIREIGLPKLTPFTITEPDMLDSELAEIRHHGYATSFQEVRLDHVGIGAPIFDYRRRVVAALSVAGPQSRFPQERLEALIQEVVETAGEASFRLGFPATVLSAY